jgi:predicted RNase H-like HicB family nuclease
MNGPQSYINAACAQRANRGLPSVQANRGGPMSGQLIVVKAARDEEAGVWYVESSDVPGLNAEAETLEALIELLPPIVQDLIDEGALDGIDGLDMRDRDLPIELIAHASTRLRIRAAA